jgi:hypothetical protein
MTALVSGFICGADTARRPPTARNPAAGALDRDYWLRHCEGYRVDGAEGRIGFVDSIRQDADGASVLAVRAGRLGRRLLLVAASDVASVVPRAERIWLASPAAIVGSEAARDDR